MTLSELIAGVEDHEKRLTVFNADEAVAAEFREYFADRNVRVATETTPSGKPGQFVTLSENDEVLTATGIGDLQEAIEGDETVLGVAESPYRPILDHLDETMFTSWGIDQMVSASREIEDRAWRVGEGQLHAGFQYLSTLRGELPVYERLASKDLDVHAYAAPDEDPPEYEGFTLHIERSEEIEKSWFVVFDGGASATPQATGGSEARGASGRSSGQGPREEAGDGNGVDDNKCALVAEERGDREFYGFWTYDADTVDWIIDYLNSTYGVLEQ